MEHSELLLEAKVAIDRIYEDQSVDLRVTFDSLQEVADLIQMNMDSIESDMLANRG